MSLRFARVLLWAGLAAILAVTAYLLAHTTFMPYDDEGYVLISLQNYLSGLRLYDDVFSQYGPWPFVYHELITTLLHTGISHTLGRALTSLHWIGMALLCALVAWRLTRSQLAAAATAIITFGLTWQNTSEPSHPGSHISLLVALAAALVTALPAARRPILIYSALGAITGLLLLTKINVGLLMAAGLGCLALRFTPWPQAWHKAAAALALAGLLATPWVLLGNQLGLAWVLTFAVQFTLAAAALLWIVPAEMGGPGLPKRAWLAAPLACLLIGGLVCIRVLALGTGIHSLVDTIIISPLRMPAKFMVGLTWYPEVWLLSLTSVVTLGRAGWEIRKSGRLSRPTLWIVTLLRIVPVVAFVAYARAWPSYFGIFHFACYCLPLLPIYALSLDDAGATYRQARWGVAVIALTQVLHAFPVAGSQLAWATFLCVPVMVAGLFDLRVILPRLLPAGGRRLVRVGAITLAVTVTFQLGLLTWTGWGRYTHGRPLQMPGAADIRLDGATRQALRLLRLNTVIHADVLFSRQGMYSHNLWSGVPTPTAQNATQWFWLLDETKQAEIITRLSSTPRTALINSHSIDEFMIDHHIPVGGPLQDFVVQHYRPLFNYGDFTFSVPTTSKAAVFGRYVLLEPESREETVPTVLFRTNILLDGQPDKIWLERIEYPWDAGPELLPGRSECIAEPINSEGRTLGPAIRLPAQQPLRGLFRLSIISPRLPPKLPWQDYALVVEDGAGHRLSESVY